MRSRSGSATSSSSSKELSADNIAIYVNISGGKTIKINVRPVHTVSNVLEFLSASTTLPTDVRLLRAGKQLSPSSTVGELQLTDSSTLQLLAPLRGGTTPSTALEAPSSQMTVSAEEKSDTTSTPVESGTVTPSTDTGTPRTATPSSTAKKSNRPRCSKSGCKAPAQPIVGECGFCSKRFCGKHRMLESHACEGLEDARQAEKDRNTARLEGERTVMLRGL